MTTDWCQVSAEFPTKLVSAQSRVGVTAVTAHERSPLNTQIHNSNEYTKLGSQENKAKIGVLIDTNIILIMGHSLIIEIDFAHRLNKLKFFPLLNLKIEPVRFSQYYYC